jgi:hypothetical protein
MKVDIRCPTLLFSFVSFRGEGEGLHSVVYATDPSHDCGADDPSPITLHKMHHLVKGTLMTDIQNSRELGSARKSGPVGLKGPSAIPVETMMPSQTSKYHLLGPTCHKHHTKTQPT